MWVCSAVRKWFTVIPFALQLFYTMQLLPVRSAMPFLVVNLHFSAPLSLALIFTVCMSFIDCTFVRFSGFNNWKDLLSVFC